MTKRNLLLVSLLLVFGLGVMAPSAMAQLTASTSVLTLRPNSNGDAVGLITLAETATTAIPQGETFNVQFSQPIVGATGVGGASGPITDFCSSPSGYCSDFSVTASGQTLTLTVTPVGGFSWAVGTYVEIGGIRVATWGLAAGTSVTATVSTSPPVPPNTVLFSNGTNYISLIPVGTVASTTALTVTPPATPGSLLTCDTYPAPAGLGTTWTMIVAENWAGAWSAKADEQTLAPYLVTNGTFINVTVTGIPKGLTITPAAPNTFVGGAPTWGATPAAYTGGVFDDMTTFTYVITTTARTTPTSPESAVFGFGLTTTGPLAQGNPQMAVSVTLGPAPSTTSPVYPAFSYPVLGYAEELPGSPSNVFSFIDCTTPLLYPYITNYNLGASGGALGNWDTALEIANMTSVPFPSTSNLYTEPQNGSCTFSFYSAGTSTSVGTAKEATPITYTTPVVLSGGNYSFMLSSTAAAGLVGGYAVAVCNFLNGGGYAELVDNANGLGNWQTAAGYLAGVYYGQFPF